MDLSLKSRIICLFLIVCIKQGFTQQYPPSFYDLPLVPSFPENTAVNTSLMTVKAQGNNGPITISGFNDYTKSKVYIVQNSTCASTHCVATATLYLNREMDRETESVWNLNIVATDHLNLKTVATILIFITDVNDEDPVFDSKLYQITLPEDSPINTTVLTVHAVDSDNGIGGLVNYTLKGTGQSTGLYDGAFSIHQTSSNVTLEKKLDYSKLSFYQYLIIAMDGEGRTGNASLIIKVKDIQNKPPYFTGLPYNTRVDENTTPGTTLNLTIRADDGDIGDPHHIEYSFQSGTCINLFEIDNKYGNVTIKNKIDRDEGVVLQEHGVCTLILMAKETLGENETADIKDITSNTTVVITINDKDDNKPMFGETSYNASVYENVKQVPLTINGTNINVTDTDQGANSLLDIEVQYENGTAVEDLSPVPKVIQGQGSISLYLQKAFDHEKVQYIEYKVIARQTNNPNQSSEVIIHVEILDMNDNTPKFSSDSFIVSIPESKLGEQIVLSETATDLDSGNYGQIVYSLRGGGTQFAVDNTTGVITKQNNVLLDREKRDEYVLTLMARDGGGNLQTVEVTVKLKDVNDNPPKCSQSLYIGFIKENNSRFDQNVTVSAFDRDQKNTNNSRVKFLLESSLDGIEENFTISTVKQSDMSYSGCISLTTPLDYEKLNSSINGKIKLYVQAVDFGIPSLNTTCVVEIIVQDINDNTPYFNASIYIASILENATSDTYVTTVYAHDDDGTPVNKEINFYIDKGGNDHFRINGKSGQITVDKNAEFDRETRSRYNLIILATDRGTPARTGTTTVMVIIDDVNDSPPKFTESNFKKAVYENVAIGFIVANCSAVDLDENSYLKYKIVGVRAEAGGKNVNESSVKNYFEINNNTGIVMVKSPLDREVADTITLVLTVEDLNAVTGSMQTATASLQVTLLDVNDNSPVFQQRSYHVNINEGKISGPVITVTATDKDLNSHITYMITKNYNNTFKIDSSTGLITRDRSKDIDRETCQTIVIEILANDTVHNGTTEVNMTILDVNDNTPTFQEHTSIVYLLENYGTNQTLRYYNTCIADLNATDIDEGPNAELTYKLINNYTKFKIDPFTGVITADGHFDREDNGGNEYTLTITVNDNDIDVNKRRTSTTTLTVHINDTNDNAPYFQEKNNYTFMIQENVDPGFQVATVSALDKDLYQEIWYFIDHENSNDTYLFKIDENNGVIETNGSLVDKYGRYKLRVNATDDGGLTGYTSVQIIVKDINNNPPQFQHLNSTYDVYECAHIGSLITTLVATDADSGANKNIAYYFVNQTSMEGSHTDFKLDSINGEIKTANNLSVDVHPVYYIRVGVRDHGIPVLSSTADITIKVIDVNNHPPKFEPAIENATVMENTENVTIKTVKAKDQDAGSKLVYSIDKGTHSDNFRIDNYTGDVTIIKSLDRENITMVRLNIKAVDISKQLVSDQCSPSVLTHENSAMMVLRVYIQDQNDHKPQFKSSYLSKGVRRTVNKGVTIFDLKDHVELDPDIGINSIHQFILNGEFKYSNTTKLEQQINRLTGTLEECSGNKLRKPICLTGNGTVLTNIHFEENMNGFIDMPVLVRDAAGNSTAVLRLYIISDYQTAAILLNGNKAFVESIQDSLMGHLTQKLGLNFTSDGIRAVEKGDTDHFKSTYLDFHVVDPGTQRILSAREAIDLFDQHSSVLSQLLKTYMIFDVVPYAETMSKSNEQGIKTTYILTGVIALLGVIVLLVGIFYCKSISRYQRKLKAATTKSSVDQDTDLKASHPGTNIYARNQNPLLNKEEDFSKVDYDRYDNDDLSVTSYDSNQFKKKEPTRGEEEKGATMDMYHEEINMQGEIDALAMVLQQHRQEKAASQENLVSSETQNGHVQSNDLNASFVNEGFDLHFETTEV